MAPVGSARRSVASSPDPSIPAPPGSWMPNESSSTTTVASPVDGDLERQQLADRTHSATPFSPLMNTESAVAPAVARSRAGSSRAQVVSATSASASTNTRRDVVGSTRTCKCSKCDTHKLSTLMCKAATNTCLSCAATYKVAHGPLESEARICGSGSIRSISSRRSTGTASMRHSKQAQNDASMTLCTMNRLAVR